MNEGAICWRSSKQKSVAKSTTEAEYMASSDASQEAVWIRYLLPKLGQQHGPTTIHGDNMGAIALAKNPITRHINVSYHFVRDSDFILICWDLQTRGGPLIGWI